jgi:protein-tyrosine phosphatase
MRNVFWLRDGVIGGRCGPNRDAWDAAVLYAGGVRAVLSVNDGELVYPQDLSKAGIEYSCVPLSDAAPPRLGDLETCLDALPRALSFAVGMIECRGNVLVHCSSGKDRTGLFLSYYLCKMEGLEPGEAIQEVRRVRPIAFTAEGWEAFARQVLAVSISM